MASNMTTSSADNKAITMRSVLIGYKKLASPLPGNGITVNFEDLYNIKTSEKKSLRSDVELYRKVF